MNPNSPTLPSQTKESRTCPRCRSAWALFQFEIGDLSCIVCGWRPTRPLDAGKKVSADLPTLRRRRHGQPAHGGKRL